MSTHPIFKSKRLRFRQWKDSDLPLMTSINSSKNVMEFFPNTQGEEETKNFIQRMQTQFKEKGFCYFAVDELETEEFIGFIGLSQQTYPAEFTPCIDIGWRLSEVHWGKGYATEGALACLEYAFKELQLTEIVAVCPKVNLKSESVMLKIGMQKVLEFKHVYLSNHPHLETCVCYKITNT